ncbi:ABC transporter permease [Glaciihabitans sp. dw_435]|uniref:ABC transporter permease n=1 Tax=Glaciihabitans sp. dw_435 TaxID=2720081 RepID=UPI001BD5BE03|nr:ABC transporter permease subunit [Glaciihabitans sp. dw_435]
MRTSTSRTRAILAPVIFGLAVLVIWQVAVVVLGIKPYVLPSPINIGGQFTKAFDTVWAGTRVTGFNALIGLILGAVTGIIAAIISALARVFDEIGLPVITAASVVPIVALAPVLYTMFGAGAETARQLIAALAVFIPVYVNSLRGLRQVKPVHRDLMRAYAVSSWQVTRTVTLPGAVPFIFTGLRIASSLAVISALIAEYFGGPIDGLAKSITSAASYSNYTLAYAFVLGAILLGLVFYMVTLALEKLATRHRPSLS